jgi:hypothetical protein
VWEQWEEDARKAYPVRWLLTESLPDLWYPINRTLSKAWYWLRTHTYNRYHIINLKCPENGYNWGWIDPDAKMLFACFNILVDFVENELVQDHIDWMADEAHSHAIVEIHELYTWWKYDRPPLEDKGAFLDEEDGLQLDRLMKIRGFLWT